MQETTDDRKQSAPVDPQKHLGQIYTLIRMAKLMLLAAQGKTEEDSGPFGLGRRMPSCRPSRRLRAAIHGRCREIFEKNQAFVTDLHGPAHGSANRKDRTSIRSTLMASKKDKFSP